MARPQVPRRPRQTQVVKPVRARPARSEPAVSKRKFAAAKRAPARPAKLKWPVPGGVLSSHFGRRWGRLHEGIDIAAAEGTRFLAADDGKVVYSGKLRGYGNIIILLHDSGLSTVYAHNKRNLVYEGDLVRRGERLGLVGETGRSTAPHLHFEVRQGDIPRDPKPHLEMP